MLQVSDTATTDTITVTVTITDAGVTITSGQTANLIESSANNAAVMTVGTSGDTPTLFTITGGNADGIFAISNGGAITVADNSNLDHEGTGQYTLTIIASDATSADVETVTITITDANDNTPVFDDDDGDQDTSTAAATVAENVQTVGTYDATDGDAGASLTYSIINANANAGSVDHDLFSINGQTGALTFTNAPNFEAPGCGADDLSLIHITEPTRPY